MMLTSGGSAEPMQPDGEQLGVAAYLLKPVRRAELREAIERALGAVAEARRRNRRLSCPRQERRGVSSALSVLLAEDNDVNQRLAKQLLEKRGHRVVVAGNGRQALDLLTQTEFDLVLMDVQMPEMDGLEATAALRASEKESGRHVLSHRHDGSGDAGGDRERCLAAGMDVVSDQTNPPARAR